MSRDIDSELLKAVRKDNVSVVEKLLKDGANPNVINKSKKNIIYFVKSLEVAKLLVENGLDLGDEWVYAAVYQGCNDKRYEIADYLLKCAEDINAEYNVLALSVIIWDSKPDLKMLELLLQNGMDVNALIEGETALILAIERSNLEVVKLLLRYGADVNIMDYRGRTALDVAIKEKNKTLVKLLLGDVSPYMNYKEKIMRLLPSYTKVRAFLFLLSSLIMFSDVVKNDKFKIIILLIFLFSSRIFNDFFCKNFKSKKSLWLVKNFYNSIICFCCIVYLGSVSMVDYFVEALTYNFRAFCCIIFIVFLLVSIIDGLIKFLLKYYPSR